MKLVALLKVLLLLFGIMALSSLGTFALIWWQQEGLSEKTLILKKGMKIEEVIKIMGPPKYIGETESQYVVKGDISAWHSEFEEVSNNKETYRLYNYYVEHRWFPFMKKLSGNLIISVYLSYFENTIVYVSEHHGME
jgi:hypothetical protein